VTTAMVAGARLLEAEFERVDAAGQRPCPA